MICPECSEDRNPHDFLMSDICFRCAYNKKVEKRAKMRPKCPICGESIPSHRSVFCCQDCARIGAKKKKNDYWTRHVTVQLDYRYY